METKELGLTLTIGFIAVTALGTRSARISRVNKVDSYTRLLRLVSDKTFQLVKSPIAHLPSHSFVKTVGSLPYPCQGFESERLMRGKCRLHKLFTVLTIGTTIYVRVYATKRATEWGYSLYEFEVYGP